MSRCAPLQHEIPPMKDLTTDNITDNVIITNNQCNDPRTRFIFEHLVRHLHEFARETRLTSQEWMTAIEFLTADIKGQPVANAQCDVWEGDSHGFYDVQNPNREHPDGRAVIRSNEQGIFYFTAVVPVPYPIPDDGPVGDMLKRLNRHPNRLGLIHFMIDAPEYDKLVTALYPRGDPYETSDPVFGVKESLIVDLGTVDRRTATEYNVPEGTKQLSYDFVLASEAEATALKIDKANEEANKTTPLIKKSAL